MYPESLFREGREAPGPLSTWRKPRGVGGVFREGNFEDKPNLPKVLDKRSDVNAERLA